MTRLQPWVHCVLLVFVSVAKKMKTTEETPKKKPQQARAGPSACAPTTSSALLCERAEGTAAPQVGLGRDRGLRAQEGLCRALAALSVFGRRRFAKWRHSGHLVRARQKRGKRFRDINVMTSPPSCRRVAARLAPRLAHPRAPPRTPIFRRLELFPSQRGGGSSSGASASVSVSPVGCQPCPLSPAACLQATAGDTGGFPGRRIPGQAVTLCGASLGAESR